MATKTKTGSKSSTTIIDPVAAALAAKLRVARDTKDAWDALVKSATEELSLHMSRYREEMESDRFTFADGWKVNFVKGKGASRISGDKLLERGVSPEIIAFATVEGTEYTQTLVERPKPETDLEPVPPPPPSQQEAPF